MAPWAPLVWKTHEPKQGCTSTLPGEAKTFEFMIGILGMDHVHVCHCFVHRILVGKQGHVYPAVVSHQCHLLQERCLAL